MEPVALSGAGRVQLEEGEVECYRSEGVHLEQGGQKVLTAAVITSRRCVFVEAGLGFGLGRVASARMVTTRGFFGTREAILQLELEALASPDGTSSAPHVPVTLTLRSSAVRDKFHEQLDEQSRRFAAELDAEQKRAAAKLAEQTFTTTRAGVSGIIRAQGRENASVGRAVDTAFSDLSTLMAHAKEMVAVAQQLANRDRAAQDAYDEQQRHELERFKLFGITSPVTRRSHGASFHAELSRQLCDFLSAPLLEGQGVLALTDAYCIFNRARGTELVSPSDLLSACELLPELGLPMRLHTFSSGVLALRLLQGGDEGLESRIVALACRRTGVTAVELGLSTGLSLLLANEFLLSLEQQGRLCRDGKRRDSLAFYPNIFASNRAEAKRALETLTELPSG